MTVLSDFSQTLLKKVSQQLTQDQRHLLVLNSDELELKQAFLDVKKSFLQDHPDVELSLLDAKPYLEELNTFPMFTQSKYVFALETGEFATKYLESLLAFLSRKQQKVFLVLGLTQITPKLKKSLLSHCQLFEKVKGKPWERTQRLENLLRKTLETQKITLEPEAFQFLFREVIEDEKRLLQEIEKLQTLACSQKSITLSQVKALIPAEAKGNFWELLELLFQKDRKPAQDLLSALYLKGEVPLQLLYQLRYQTQVLLKLCYALQSSSTLEAFQKQYPYLKGKLLSKKMQEAKKIGQVALKSFLKRLFETEVKMKSESESPERLLSLALINWNY